MKAGVELDKLVAEKVMGWKDVWQPFQPSTEISDAWMVVEKLDTFLYMYRSEFTNFKYECKLSWHDSRNYYALADTAPLAICLAALKAVNVEVTS